jgi:hypothetical protein
MFLLSLTSSHFFFSFPEKGKAAMTIRHYSLGILETRVAAVLSQFRANLSMNKACRFSSLSVGQRRIPQGHKYELKERL